MCQWSQEDVVMIEDHDIYYWVWTNEIKEHTLIAKDQGVTSI